MSVGGRIIEIRPMVLTDEDTPSFRKDVVRLWCKDTTYPDDETAVFAEPFAPEDGPKLGDEIWWQSGKIYFDQDRRSLVKVGYSFDPRRRP